MWSTLQMAEHKTNKQAIVSSKLSCRKNEAALTNQTHRRGRFRKPIAQSISYILKIRDTKKLITGTTLPTNDLKLSITKSTEILRHFLSPISKEIIDDCESSATLRYEKFQTDISKYYLCPRF